MEATRRRKTLETFRGVLKGKKWPVNYWKDSLGKERARICVKYMISKEYGDTFPDELEYRVKKTLFTKYKLTNMLNTVYHGDAKIAILDGLRDTNPYYRNELMIYNDISLKKRERHSAGEDISAVKDLMKRTIVNNMKDEDVVSSIRTILYRYDLIEDFKKLYNSKVTLLAQDLFPNKFKTWELAYADGEKLDDSYWSIKANRNEAYNWLMDVTTHTAKKTYKQLGLEGLVSYYADNYTDTGSSRSSLIFPMHNEFNPGKITPVEANEDGYKDYWKNNREIARLCTKWLLSKLDLTDNSISTITYSDFMNNHLAIMLSSLYNGDVFLAINDILPGKFSRWDFLEHPSYLWDDRDTRIDALKWLFKKENIDIEYLVNNSYSELPDTINEDLFNKYNLNYLFKVFYKRSILEMLKDIFPNKTFDETDDNINYIDYKKLFGEYTELNLCQIDNGEISVDSDELSKIFKGNPNFWGSHQPNFSHKVWLDQRKETSVLKSLLNNKMKIYKYSIDEVDEPKTPEEIKKGSYLARHSRAKYSNTAWLYWRAYKFFEKANLYLDCYDTIMGLSSNDKIGSYFSYTDNDEIDIPYTRVRCGDLSFDKLDMLLSSGVDYLWIFPFDEDDFDSPTENNKIDIYLIEPIYDYKQAHEDEMHSLYLRYQESLDKELSLSTSNN